MCWYCHWGLPKPVADIYIRAVTDLGGNEFPLTSAAGHVVWSDYNFHMAQNCLDDPDNIYYNDGFEPWEIEILYRSLRELAALPESAWDVEPDTHGDFQHPENYPPPPGVAMVKV